eukprot:gene7569-722_t
MFAATLVSWVESTGSVLPIWCIGEFLSDSRGAPSQTFRFFPFLPGKAGFPFFFKAGFPWAFALSRSRACDDEKGFLNEPPQGSRASTGTPKAEAMMKRGFLNKPPQASRASMRTPEAEASHPAAKSKGPPRVLLSELVCEQEAMVSQMLKVMATYAPGAASVKNYHLELLTLLAQDAAAARGGARVADGSMQLVLDVLQSITDDKMPTAGAAETQVDLSEDQFRGLVSALKVKLVFGHPGPGSRQHPSNSVNVAIVNGMSVLLEDLAHVVPDLPGIILGRHCIKLSNQAQLEARGCVFSSPNASCIGAGGRSHCHLIDCCFGPGRERGASERGVILEGSSRLVAERGLFLRCHKVAAEVRGAGFTAHFKGCTFYKCKKQAVMLHRGGKELVMEDCLIERCGGLPADFLLVAFCGIAQLHKCLFVNNKSGAVLVQCDIGKNAPALDMRECILKGNMSGVTFGFAEGVSSSGGSGIFVNNQITDHARVGISINAVTPNQKVQLIDNVFQGNWPNAGQGNTDVYICQNVQDQVVMKNNRGTIHNLPYSASDALRLGLGYMS